jgi:hypothetical protein
MSAHFLLNPVANVGEGPTRVRRFLGDSDELPGWKEVGATFDLDEKTARSRAETVVRCFRAVLWDLIATDIGSEKTFENELRNLIGIL